MASAGVRLLAGLDEASVMGIAEVVRELPRLWRLRRRVRRRLRPGRTDLFVPIDAPAFHLPLGIAARRCGVPVLYYVVPQVWAWREGRARRLARACDRACAILPFEAEPLRRHGVDARFVGHPLLDRWRDRPGGGARPRDEDETRRHAGDHAGGAEGARARDRAAGRRREGAAPTLALFPGSRTQEVTRMLPPFAAAARRIRRVRPELRVVVAVPPGLPEVLYGERPPGRLVDPATAFEEATAALTKSGTVTLELALAGVPMVVAHRVSPLTYRLARRLVEVEHIALVNLVADRRVVPELIQDEATPEALSQAILPLLERGSTPRLAMQKALNRIPELLGTPGASGRVADHALALLGGEAP